MFKSFLIKLLFVVFVNASVSPSDVYNNAKGIKVALANEVMKKSGVSMIPVIDIDLSGAVPANVYSMAEALNYKVFILASTNKKPWKGSVYPSEDVKPKHVQSLLNDIRKNLEVIYPTISFPLFTSNGKKPADVMYELTLANLWIDKLMPFVKPSYPLAVIKRSIETVDILTSEIDDALEDVKVYKRDGIKPEHVFVNATTTYNILKTVSLGLYKKKSPTHPYNIASAVKNIKPVDVYTIGVFNLFYLYTLAAFNDLHYIAISSPLKIEKNVKPNDVYMAIDELNFKLMNLVIKLESEH